MHQIKELNLPLDGRRCLFFGIGFYEYEIFLVRRLRELGADVTFISLLETPKSSKFTSIIAVRNNRRRKVENKIKKKLQGKVYDQVLVIKGSQLSLDFMGYLRQEFSSAEFILYQWDAIVRVPYYEYMAEMFDTLFSSERLDCLAGSQMTFRPLFAIPNNFAKKIEKKYDINFIGHLHSKRLMIAKSFETSRLTDPLTGFLYFYTGPRRWLKELSSPYSKYIHCRPISYEKVMEINRQSSVILDMPHEHQFGLSFRIIEAIAQGQKIITSNADIRNYNFFDPKNIAVVPVDNFTIDMDFVFNTPINSPDRFTREFTLDNWITDVLR